MTMRNPNRTGEGCRTETLGDCFLMRESLGAVASDSEVEVRMESYIGVAVRPGQTPRLRISAIFGVQTGKASRETRLTIGP